MEIDAKTSVINSLTTSAFVMVNKSFLRKFTSLGEAVILSELLSTYKYHQINQSLEMDDAFAVPLKYYERQLGMSFFQQNRALKALQAQGMVQLFKRGFPAVRVVKIDFEKIQELLAQPDPEVQEMKQRKEFYEGINQALGVQFDVSILQSEALGNMKDPLKASLIVISSSAISRGMRVEWTPQLVGRLRTWTRMKSNGKEFDYSLISRTFQRFRFVDPKATFKDLVVFFLTAAKETPDVYYTSQQRVYKDYIEEVLR